MSESELTSEQYQKLFNHICNRWGITEEEKAQWARSPTDIDTLLSIAVALDEMMPPNEVKAWIVPVLEKPVLTLLQEGRAEDLLGRLEFMMGGPLLPSRKKQQVLVTQSPPEPIG